MAGGQATNSGIDYQQRIAAWCLINQYSNFDISTYFDHVVEELIIEKIHFETDAPIDDLNLACKNFKKIFLQIKRSLSLSDKKTSDFYMSIKQFVQEFIKNEKTLNYFGLITSSDSSSKITNDLKKIIISIRLNPNALEENPLNVSEVDTYNKFEIIFNTIYEELKGSPSSKEIFHSFIKRILIGIIDVESGNTVEIASFMLLKSFGFKKPELIWAILIKNSLLYAKERLSITEEHLKNTFDKYLEEEDNKSLDESQIELLKTEIILQGEYSTAKEVLLIESFIDNADYMIVELHRFKDDCQMKHTFYGHNKIKISKDEWTIIQRFSTMSGMERYVIENKALYSKKKVVIIPANETETIEETDCAKLYKSYLQSLIEKNTNVLLCLHCGKRITEDNSIIIEVEDKNTAPAIGIAHKICLRPIDRILGTVQIPERKIESNLETFDFNLWVSLMMKGQSMLNAVKDSNSFFDGKIPIIGWNSNEEYDSDYSYCIKFILEDGSNSYAYKRNRIERVSLPQAEEYLMLFKESQEMHYKKNDPLSILSINQTYGAYSQLIKIKKAEEKILEIKSAEVAKYSKLIAKVFDRDLLWYAPLCLIRDKNTEAILNLSNVIPILSDPLQFSSFLENWKELDFNVGDCELKIIKSDKDFDNYMRMFFGDKKIPILDPLFDKNFELVKGFLVKDFQKMVKERKNEEHS